MKTARQKPAIAGAKDPPTARCCTPSALSCRLKGPEKPQVQREVTALTRYRYNNAEFMCTEWHNKYYHCLSLPQSSPVTEDPGSMELSLILRHWKAVICQSLHKGDTWALTLCAYTRRGGLKIMVPQTSKNTVITFHGKSFNYRLDMA